MECCDESKVDIKPYDGENDVFWKKLKIKMNVNTMRRLKIVTYGTVYISEKPKICQAVYNASILRGGQDKRSLTFKMLVKSRGTDLRIQQDVRNAVLFEKFISDVIYDFETKNLDTVAIICRAGHHRSVACAEMLKYLYTNITVEHITIAK